MRIRTSKVAPTDTTAAGIRVREVGMLKVMTYPYPYAANDPHEHVARSYCARTGTNAPVRLRTVKETPYGYMFETE